EDKQLYAFDSIGALNWSYQHPGGTGIDYWRGSPVISAAGEIWTQARRSLVAFDSVGTFAWSYWPTGAPTDPHYSSPAMGSDGSIYWGAGTVDTVYAIDSSRAFAWSYRTSDTLQSSCAIGSAGNVYIGCYDNNLYAFTSDGALAWSYLMVGDVYSSPAIDTSENIYVAQDDRVYAFTTYDGALVWTYVAYGSINSSPAIGSGGRLYVGSLDNNIYAIGTASITYDVYGDADGEESWIAVPLCDTGYDTTEELGNAIAALFTSPANLDTILIEWLTPDDQVSHTTTGTYYSVISDWVWANSADIIIGTLYKVVVTLAGGAQEVELTLTGCACSVEFTIYDGSGSNDNENWISVPWSKWYLDTTFDLGASTVYWWPDVTNLDTWHIDLWDIDNQATDTTIGTYYDFLGDWLWTNEYDIWPGMPFVTCPTDKNDEARSITWP
ncbi:MAG: PQQ-binding-like beta-propeller repeat protein, partial [bacterium]